MQNFNDYIKLIHSIEDLEILSDFIIGATTPKERDELVKRIEIIKLLISGESQKNIARKLKVGIATVTRGSKELSKGHFKILRSEE